jgi:hypothetical protein
MLSRENISVALKRKLTALQREQQGAIATKYRAKLLQIDAAYPNSHLYAGEREVRDSEREDCKQDEQSEQEDIAYTLDTLCEDAKTALEIPFDIFPIDGWNHVQSWEAITKTGLYDKEIRYYGHMSAQKYLDNIAEKGLAAALAGAFFSKKMTKTEKSYVDWSRLNYFLLEASREGASFPTAVNAIVKKYLQPA